MDLDLMQEGIAMNADAGNQSTGLEAKLLEAIDKLAEGARAIVVVAWPIMEDIRAAATVTRKAFGEAARSAGQKAEHRAGDDHEAAEPGSWKGAMAALLIIGALGCGSAYFLRPR